MKPEIFHVFGFKGSRKKNFKNNEIFYKKKKSTR